MRLRAGVLTMRGKKKARVSRRMNKRRIRAGWRIECCWVGLEINKSKTWRERGRGRKRERGETGKKLEIHQGDKIRSGVG
jgi:hypothetical protein